MIQNELMATWELFLGEISRNASPQKHEIIEGLQFLLDRDACSEKRFEAIVSVRNMAAYEQAINEYLHPPTDFKQANIKAELIHFGSLFEGISEILLTHLYKNKIFSLSDYNEWFPKQAAYKLRVSEERLSKEQKNGRLQALSFKAVIDCLSSWNKNKNKADPEFSEYLKVIDMLRYERNMVHINQMVNTSILHEEYKLVEVREKWFKFILLIEKQI